MRHARFDVALLTVDHQPVTLKAAYLLVAEQEGHDELQWECVAYGMEDKVLPQGRYAVEVTALDGRLLGGPGVVVRSVEGSHVIRGDGPLDGFARSELGGS